MEIKLNKWELKGCWANEPLLYDPAQYTYIAGVTNWMDASVPGSVYADLIKYNIIEDPYFDINSTSCEWVANRWWMYKTEFTIDSDIKEKNLEIIFKGIDYSGYISLNGKIIVRHEGMFIECRINIDEYVNREGINILYVVLEGAPNEMSMYGFTSKTSTQKSRFGYKWDFSTRLVDIGLYGEVVLLAYDICRFDDIQITPAKKGEDWSVEAKLSIKALRDMNATLEFELDGAAKKSVIIIKEGINDYNTALYIENAKLWWPSGHGEQPLYTLKMTLSTDKGTSDSRTYKVGLRTLEYRRTEGSSEEHLPYIAVINGKAIYLKGVNYVPIDHMAHGDTVKRYREMLAQVKAANMNAIRVWGGGVIEREEFYNLCDELGILVWQDFIQSSSSIEDYPSKDEKFLELLKRVSTFVIKQKRNHTCLTYWCGGNELMDEEYSFLPTRPERNNHPATFKDKNLAMLKSLVDKYDKNRLMTPASASGVIECLEHNTSGTGVHQDVHGPWRYGGVIDHYTLMNNSDSMLHSEFGCDAFNSLDTLDKVLSRKHISLINTAQNLVWRHHGGDWATYEYREKVMFGEFRDDEMATLVTCSQYMQGEGLRYMIESNRRRAWRNCGCFIWQFNEPWANIACTSIVDYFGNKKLAYNFIADAYRTQMPSLRYNKLFYKAGEEFNATAFVHNELEAMDYTLKCTVSDMRGNIIKAVEMNGMSASNSSAPAGDIVTILPEVLTDGFTVTLELFTPWDNISSEYLMFIPDPNKGFADRYLVCEYAAKFNRG